MSKYNANKHQCLQVHCKNKISSYKHDLKLFVETITKVYTFANFR